MKPFSFVFPLVFSEFLKHFFTQRMLPDTMGHKHVDVH